MKHLAIILMMLLTTTVLAENLGKKAPTYELDPDAREVIKDIFRDKERTGELDKFWKNYRTKAIASIKNPMPLGIKSTYDVRTELHNLKFKIKRDLINHKGQVVVKAGSVMEPLKVSPLSYGLIFIDGRDQKQVDYAIAKGRKEPLKIVLTAGSAYELRVRYQNTDWWEGENIPFYFDQRKMIINTLKNLYGIDLNSVPVKLAQRGHQLAVEYGMLH